jgi:hypothetical protein
MNPKATRPLEYVAFFSFEVATKEGNGHVFLAVDAYLDFVFQLGVERDRKPETVLKNIYFLIEHPDFTKHSGNGFTLVLEEFQELSTRIEAIIEPSQGKLLFNKGYNNTIANPVLFSFRNILGKRPQ